MSKWELKFQPNTVQIKNKQAQILASLVQISTGRFHTYAPLVYWLFVTQHHTHLHTTGVPLAYYTTHINK